MSTNPITFFSIHGVSAVNCASFKAEGRVLTTHDLNHCTNRFWLEKHSHKCQEGFCSRDIFCTEALCRDLDMSGIALLLHRIVILQIQVVQQFEKSQWDIKTGRLAAILCPSKLFILFKPVVTAYEVTHRIKFCHPYTLLMFFLTEALECLPSMIRYHFTWRDTSIFTCSSLHFQSLAWLKSKLKSCRNSSRTIGVSVPCIYWTEQISSVWL